VCGKLRYASSEAWSLNCIYAAERVALSSGRNVWTYMSLKKSENLPLEGSDLFCWLILLSFRCTRLPLKCKHVKDGSCSFFTPSYQGWAVRDKCCDRGRDTAIAD